MRCHPEERAVCATKDLNPGAWQGIYELWGHGASRGPKITADKEAGKRLLRSTSRPPSGGQACTKNSHLLRRNSGSRNYHEGAAGGWRSFWPPDAPLEPQNEGIHFRGTQWHSY